MSHGNARFWIFIPIFTLLILIVFGALPARAVADDANCDGKKTTACNVVNGYAGNQVVNALSGTIAGGGMPELSNRVLGDGGTVGGGVDNQAGGQATVSGGASNTAAGYRATVGGGSNNTAHTAFATIGGGVNNIADGLEATISGGSNNLATAREVTIGGGSGNIASFTLATVAGGSYNTASSIQATVGGGSHNTASGAYATVSGGSDNHAFAFDSAISGGSGNLAGADDTSIGGGLGNSATDKYSTVSGGYRNRAGNENDNLLDAQYATVTGGARNQASGAFSTVAGGSDNSAGADYSVASGKRAKIETRHAGTFLFADSNEADFQSASANEFAARATGGVRFVTAIDASGKPMAGVVLAPGGGSWQVLSDRNAKTNLASVDRQSILDQVAGLPLATYSYKTQDPAIRHIGPMAQDWAMLGVGESDKYINASDETGIALAAIQGLYDLVQQQSAEIDALEAEQNARAVTYTSVDPSPLTNGLFMPIISLLCGAFGVFVGARLGRQRSQ